MAGETESQFPVPLPPLLTVAVAAKEKFAAELVTLSVCVLGVVVAAATVKLTVVGLNTAPLAVAIVRVTGMTRAGPSPLTVTEPLYVPTVMPAPLTEIESVAGDVP